jgi:PAS domain S-box-containing protein
MTELPAFAAAVLDGLPEAVIVTAPDGQIVFINPAVTSLLGYEAAEVVGQPITVLTPRQSERRVDPVKWLARWAAEPDFEQSRFLDLVARRRDGRELTVEVRVREGRFQQEARYFITVRDNTARRLEQAALKDANLRAARILMVAEDAIVSIDAEERIQDFNLAAEKMFGYRAEEVLGQPLGMLIPPWARSAHERHVAEFAKGRQPSRMMSERRAVMGQRRSGETFALEATITKVAAGGSLTFAAHLRDVTERNRQSERLKESDRRIRAVFDHAHTPIALLSPDGTVLEINRAGAALAAEDGTVKGAALWAAPWLGVPAASAQAQGERLRAAVLEASRGAAQVIAVPLAHDGSPAAIEVRLTPIFDDAHLAYILAEGRLETNADRA